MTQKVGFVHLHTHAASLRDAALRLEDAIIKAKESNQKAYALTDHGVLHFIPELFRLCAKHDIKPIAGCETYLTEGSRSEPSKHFHQLLIAKNETGWQNLMKLSSEAFMTGFYNKPRIDMELLRKHSEGLIATSACLAGIIPQAIANGEMKRARKLAQEFKDIFGDDFYIEIQPNKVTIQQMVNDELIKIGKELGIEFITTADVHYNEKEDCTMHAAMLCRDRNQKMLTEKTPGYDGNTYYVQTAKEMFTHLKQHNIELDVIINAMNNTVKVADKVDFDLGIGKQDDLLPTFPVEEGQTADKAIGEMVKEGLMRKVDNPTKTYIDRIKFELEIIRSKGYSDYFLITADAIKFAKSRNIQVAPARGSAAGSLVAYLMDITEVDPIKHTLFFERFMDITRQKMPDIDTDIEDIRRYEVLDYLKEKYGHDRVAQVVNIVNMTVKTAFKTAFQVYDVPFGTSQAVTDLVPDTAKTYEEALELSPQLKKAMKATYKRNGDDKVVSGAEIFDVAKRFVGTLEKLSKHAGGILITPTPISDRFPLFGTKELAVVQWDKDDVEDMGGVKFDFLGLKMLRIIGMALDNIERETGERVDLSELYRTLDDTKVFERIAEGNTQNTFQFNSSGMQQLCKAVKPDSFKDLVAINALYRPHALQNGEAWRYASIKSGKEEAHYSHPEEKEFTGDSYGVIAFQEHAMQLTHHFAGWDYNKGQLLRKKGQEQLEEMREEFIRDCAENGYPVSAMDEMWTRIKTSLDGYGFNKSHGVAYSMISYVTAWLEEYYPSHWLAAIMTTKSSDKDKVAQVFQEVKRQGFDFQAPDINRGTEEFTATNGKIVFPVGLVKGVGDGAVEEIMQKKPFKDFEDIIERADSKKLSARAMKPLILAGALDNLYPDLDRKEQLVLYYKSKKDNKKVKEAEAMEWSKDIQAEHEKKLLGIYVTYHPLDKYFFRAWSEYVDGQKDATAGGIINKVKSFNDKNGNRMAFVSIDTSEGIRELVLFSNVFSKCEEMLVKGNGILAQGKKDGEKMLANTIKELN